MSKLNEITMDHYEYANKLVSILGFNNLVDYNSVIQYSKLKEHSVQICDYTNKTMVDFKRLFPQSSFDLRKIKYTFSNIDQVVGFTKKVLNYLCVPITSIRIKESTCLRLIPINKAYIEYIGKMCDIPQNPPALDIKMPNEIVKFKYSEVLSRCAKLPQVKTYEFTSYLTLSAISMFKHIYSVSIRNTDGSRLAEGTVIQHSSGGMIIYDYVIDSKTVFNIDNYTVININFINFNSKYSHEIHVCGKIMAYTAQINGCDFLSSTPDQIYKLYSIELDNDPKYSGMSLINGILTSCVPPKHKPGGEYAKILEKLKTYNSLNKISVEKLNINNNNYDLIVIDTDNGNDIQDGLYLLMALNEPAIYEYINSISPISKKDLSICCNSYVDGRIDYIELYNDIAYIYIPIFRSADLIKYIEILNTSNESFTYNVSLCYNNKNTDLGDYKSTTTNLIQLQNYYPMVTMIDHPIYLIIKVDYKYKNWLYSPNMRLGVVYCDTLVRRNCFTAPWSVRKGN